MKTTAVLFAAFAFLSASCQPADDTIKSIEHNLKSGSTTISDVLCNPAYLNLHSLTSFREMIKRNATAGKITMVHESEPGERITVKGIITDENGRPGSGILVYCYQTSDKGWYADSGAHILMSQGDMLHARLFCYLKTNAMGEFAFETVKPKGYPQSDLPAHIHIQLWDSDMKLLEGPPELLFADDPRLTPQRKERALNEGNLISSNSSLVEHPVYEYRITVASK